MATDRPPQKVVCNQPVPEDKLEFARKLRRDMVGPEVIIWRYLRGNKLGGYHFRRQQVIGKYIMDFYCHEGALAVEIDGITHVDEAYDQKRERDIREMDIHVMRFTNDNIYMRTNAVLDKIKEYLDNKKSGKR